MSTILPRTLALAITLVVLAGCASTTLTSRWVDETYDGEPFDMLLVVGASEQEHERRVFEDVFSRALSQRGIGAHQSVLEMGAGERPTLERLRALVESTGCDAILITHLVEVSEEQVYHPPTYWYDSYYYDYYYPWWGYGGYSPGYVQTHRNVILETNVYEAAGGKLVWSARSETWDPDSSAEMTRSLADLVIGDMKGRRMLQ